MRASLYEPINVYKPLARDIGIVDGPFEYLTVGGLRLPLTGMYHPRGQIFFGMQLPLRLQQRKAKAAIAKIHSWHPQRIVLSHGRCFAENVDETIRRIFGAARH